MLRLDQYPIILAALKKDKDPIPKLRNLCRTDLYFLLRYGLNRPDVEHPWLFERCREVQERPNGYLDLWSREHYKSTIITFAKSIQDILNSHGEGAEGQECTIGIFSHTRPIAKKFLSQIKFELENNRNLKDWFPDILYREPKSEAPKWSLDSGLVVKRKGNPKEATLEAWGLVDGQPTGSHFTHLIYDDVVTLGSVTSPEMIEKTTDALAISYNLGAQNGHCRRFIGTRYHFNDTYRTVMERGTATPRIYAATHNGKLDGEPVMWTKEHLEEKVRDMGTYVAACQLMQDPKADTSQGFKRDWLRYYHGSNDGHDLNRVILVDPANSKSKKSDYTAISVIGLGPDNNYYLLDFYRDKLNLTERTELLFKLMMKWNPQAVGYERYGMQTDIEHIQDQMRIKNYYFDIQELGGSMSKVDRIRRLVPIFESNRFYLPASLHKTQFDGRTIDVIETLLIEEYDPFPVPVHDDGLDCISRIVDIEISWPKQYPDIDQDYSGSNGYNTSVMAI